MKTSQYRYNTAYPDFPGIQKLQARFGEVIIAEAITRMHSFEATPTLTPSLVLFPRRRKFQRRGFFPSYLNKMQRLQNKAIRVIAKAKFRDSVTSLYYKLKILQTSELREFEIAELMHQRSKAGILNRG